MLVVVVEQAERDDPERGKFHQFDGCGDLAAGVSANSMPEMQVNAAAEL